MKKFLSISLLLWVVGASFADTTVLNYHKLSATSVGALKVPKVNIKAATLSEAVSQLQKLLDEKYPGLSPMKINFTDMGEMKPLEESTSMFHNTSNRWSSNPCCVGNGGRFGLISNSHLR